MKRIIAGLLILMQLFILSACNISEVKEYEEQLQYAIEQDSGFNNNNEYLDYNEFCDYILSKCNKNFEISTEKLASENAVLLITSYSEKIYIEIHEYMDFEESKADFDTYLFRNSARNYQYYIVMRFDNYIINAIGKESCEFLKMALNNNITYIKTLKVVNKIEINKDEFNETEFYKSIEGTKYSKYDVVDTDNGYLLKTKNSNKEWDSIIITSSVLFSENISTGYMATIKMSDYLEYVIYSNNESLFNNYIKMICK